MKKLAFAFITFILLTQTPSTFAQSGVLAPGATSSSGSNVPCAIGYKRIDNGCVPENTYVLLAPLPCENGSPGCVDGRLVTYDPTTDQPLAHYLNLMLRIFIGLCAVLAVVMVVRGGLEYMMSELVSSKEEAKSRITGAVMGLILALGSYAILNTINPNLLKTDIVPKDSATISITLDENNFSQTELSVQEAGTGYQLNRSVSGGVNNFVSEHLQKGETLRTIKVDTRNKVAYFYVGGEGEWSKFVTVPINVGLNGVSEIGQAAEGDSRTPKGVTTISGDVRIGNSGTAITDRSGRFNLGAAFINIGATANGKDRGIGFHGSANDNLGTTNGCIRMSNADLVALAPYMKPGVKVIIE